MLRFIDNCQTKVSGDHYHVTGLRAQVSSSWSPHVFVEVDNLPGIAFSLESRLKPGYYSREGGGVKCKSKISVQVNPLVCC